MHAAIAAGNMHGNRARVFAEYLPAILGLFAPPSEDFRDRVCAKQAWVNSCNLSTSVISSLQWAQEIRERYSSTHQSPSQIMDFQFPMCESTLGTINRTYTQVQEEDKGGFFAKCGSGRAVIWRVFMGLLRARASLPIRGCPLWGC